MRRSRKLFFTLIELLMVISIIAILASILLPALKKARDTSYRISCTGKMKQLGTAFTMYAGDYDCLPWYNRWFWNPGYASSGTIKPYLTEKAENGKQAFIYFECPALKATLGDFAYHSNAYEYGTDYGVNIYGYWNNATSCPKIGLVKKPSRLIILTDTLGNYDPASPTASNAYCTGFPGHPLYDKIDYRHSKGVNLLFFDGHVSWHKNNFIYPSAGTSERDMWYNE